MIYRTIGSTDIKVSAIGLGTWAIGGGPWWGTTDDAESIRTIHAAIDAGINLIDTAPVYGFGRSEEIVGKAIKGRRDKLIISTKCGLWWNDARGAFFFEQEGKKVNRSLRPDTLRLEIEQSLKRLGVDCIDIYHTHWQTMPPEKTPIAETMACLLKLKAEGKIRSIAVSNADCAQMDEYRRAGSIVANQPRYSMLDRTIETELVPYCLKHDISILVYSPLEQGLLTGKIGMDKKLAESEYRNNIAWFRPENRRRVLDLLSGWKSSPLNMIVRWPNWYWHGPYLSRALLRPSAVRGIRNKSARPPRRAKYFFRMQTCGECAKTLKRWERRISAEC